MFGQRAPLVFYAKAAGKEPVREWLRGLDEGDRLAVGQDLQRLQWRWPVGMPLFRNLGDSLWEVRSTLPSGRIARVIFYVFRGVLVALHGFIKKSQKTPKSDLELAQKRKKELEYRE